MAWTGRVTERGAADCTKRASSARRGRVRTIRRTPPRRRGFATVRTTATRRRPRPAGSTTARPAFVRRPVAAIVTASVVRRACRAPARARRRMERRAVRARNVARGTAPTGCAASLARVRTAASRVALVSTTPYPARAKGLAARRASATARAIADMASRRGESCRWWALAVALRANA